MRPFTITASPFAAALAALLLSSTSSSLQKKAIKAGQKQARAQAVYLEKNKESAWECVWGSDSSVGGSHYLSFISKRSLPDLFGHSRMNAVSSKSHKDSGLDIYLCFSSCSSDVLVLDHIES